MTDSTPEAKSDKKPVNPTGEVEVPTASDTAPDTAPETTTEAPDVVEAEQAPVATAAADTGETATPARQVVYVHAPTPPKVAHNRLFGALIALLGTAAFALIYLAVAAGVLTLTGFFDVTVLQFLNTSAYWVPILFYAIASVILAVAANRSPWWVHVIGSAILALFVYWVSVGVLTLLGNVFAMTPEEANARFWVIASSPVLILAALVAREVAMWFGLAIATRGRKVRERNAVAKAAYDAEQAEKKAEYERAAATV